MTTLLALARLWGADVTAVTVESALDVSDAIAPIAANDIGARLPGTERGATSTVIALPAAVVPPTPEPPTAAGSAITVRSEEHTSELQSLRHLVCRLLLEKKK